LIPSKAQGGRSRISWCSQTATRRLSMAIGSRIPLSLAIAVFWGRTGVVLAGRPPLVRDALEKNQPIHYFGLGSNMSRKKLQNRGINGTKIEILRMEAARVPNYRLAFSLRGFPPLEPAMGSLESIGDSGHAPILAYHRPECHGALVKLTAENYEKLMRSEGIDPNPTEGQRQGYEEIVVDAFPYGPFRRSVPAVALRARPQSRLSHDACPSARYMKILREGAHELGLKPCYQKYLADHPIQELTPWQKKQAFYNLMVVWSLSFRLKIRSLSRLQSRLLYLAYSGPNEGAFQRWLSQVMTAIILLPGAILGFVLYHFLAAIGKVPPFVQRLRRLLGEDDQETHNPI
jgi:hypothetical protein